MTVQGCSRHRGDVNGDRGATGLGGTVQQDTVGWRVTAEGQTEVLVMPYRWLLIFLALQRSFHHWTKRKIL